MKISKMIFDAVSTIFIALAIAIFINMFLIQPSTVFGESMEPTLHNGDFVIMSKIINTFDIEPDYEDIVIIDSRVNVKHSWKDDLLFTLKYNKIANMISKQIPEDRYWIKRVIGRAGDVIELVNGQVYRNGELLEEPYIYDLMKFTPNQKILIPENSIYVLGDNRNHSADSRIIGCIPIENVIGKLIYKL
ncbi:MAG: signal peptidase I [Bacillota bacterium]